MNDAAGFLEVGINDKNEVVINHPDLKPDEDGVGHIIFSVDQALHLAQSLYNKAQLADENIRRDAMNAKRIAAEAIPVNRSDITLADGSPVTDDHRQPKENGQQKDYVVLSMAERAKGFVRPVRRSYRHESCGAITTMGQSIAETYARDPKFYGATFCCGCGKHLPVAEFVWLDAPTEKVGS